MKFFFSLLFLLIVGCTFSQTTEKPFIRLVQPFKATNPVGWSGNFIIGSTCKSCTVTVDEKSVKVFSTGAFAIELNLNPGDTSFTILSTLAGRSVTKKIYYSYTLPKPAEPVKVLDIESIETYPEGNLIVLPGDRIKFKVKALTHCVVSTIQDTRLYELPVSQTKGMSGIYQGEYIVKATDSFAVMKIPITVADSLNNKFTKETKQTYSVMSPFASDIAITKGRLAHLEYGLGDDRLGGAKVGYIDSNIVLKIIGKVGTHYKVQLAKSRIAYIPEELVTLMPKGTFTPESLTAKWNVYGD